MGTQKYNIAVIGKGKTGQYVATKLLESKIDFVVFDSSNPATSKTLKNFSHAIIFVPGEIFKSLIPMLVEAKINIITGSTGFDWPEDFDHRLKEKKLTWLHSTNFALGMNLVKQLLLTMSRANLLFDDFKFNINEVHHTKKQDAPSGTAKSWADWVTHDCPITSERTGDIIGDHQLDFTTENEQITIRHQALDRSIFASGAIWSLKNFDELPYGLNHFSEVSLKHLLKE